MGDRRRWLEWGKDAAIVALSLSALYLLTMTPLVQDSGLLAQSSARVWEERGDVTLTAAAYPSRMAVNTGQGRYGVQYDQVEVDRLFAQTGPLLGEALNSAGQPEEISWQHWQDDLQQVGIYFDFSGQIPLSALGGWLQDEGQCALPGAARRIALVQGEDNRVYLSYQESSGGFFRCLTQLSASLHLEPVVEGVQENEARFAFESEQLAQLLDPYTLLTEHTGGAVYRAANPLATSGELPRLLEALSFSGQNHTAISGGQAFLEGESRLEVQEDGTVLYRAGQEGKYHVAHSGEQPTLAERIETVRQMAQATLGAYCGEARLHLISARETGEGWLIQFGYQINGSPVWLHDEGWAAQFLIREDYVTQFTLRLRSYTATGEQALLLPVERAAALLPALTQQSRELVVQYRDQGGETLAPLWVAQ
ncbi:MAG TPA: hypothetical protein IAC84_01100 [Firmicutes bacterium]|nr:hypothetical protein [Bacillota bacterium]